MRSRLLAFVAAPLVLAAFSATASPAKQAAAVDPAAVAALERMGAFLRAQKTFTIDAESTTDQVLATGQKIKQEGTAHFAVDRPSRLRIDITGEDKDRQIFYDGKTFTIFQPDSGYYAGFAAPPTLAEMVDVAEKRYGVDLPLADLFYWGSDRSKTAALQSAASVGTSVVKGVPCDHFAFRQPDVDWQIWIQRGDKPLPSKLVITTTGSSVRPEHQTVMSWNLGPKLDDRTFTFTPPAGAQKIPMLSAAPPPPAGSSRPGHAAAARAADTRTEAKNGATP